MLPESSATKAGCKKNEAADPGLAIADCRLPIADCKLQAIENQQLKIGNGRPEPTASE
jgi:hypothetical protein